MSNLFELFGARTDRPAPWSAIVSSQVCPFAHSKCFKVRKSQPSISIGTCTGRFGVSASPLIICPNRFLANRQVFSDCLPLLKHRAGNDLHIVPEIRIPGGNVDYFLVTARDGEPSDFVGIEFQGLDTTGSLWPSRQAFLKAQGLKAPLRADPGTSAGVNWKMTAKTTLVQLHHKIETFESLDRRLVLVLQDHLLEYMTREFSFGHLADPAKDSDSMHFHAYSLDERNSSLVLASTRSTNGAGIATALSLGASAEMKPDELFKKIRARMGPSTRWKPV